MKKIILFFIVFFVSQSSFCFAQMGSDGSYFWNTTGITLPITNKFDLYFGNKVQYSNQINRFDYYYFDLIGYRKFCSKFTMGLGVRQTESYKIGSWNPGQTVMFYGLLYFNPLNMKIKFGNRLTAKFSKTANTQYGLDNLSSIDFFVRSKGKFLKPYLMDEIFSNFNVGQIQTVRLYGGLHVFKREYVGIDVYYCYLQTRPSGDWKYYNVFGISTKFRI